MKKLNIYLLGLVIVMAMAGGCTKFLDLPPKNQRAVESIDDIKSVLSGYLDGYANRGLRPIAGPFPTFSPGQLMMFAAYSDDIDFEKGMLSGIFINTSNLHQQEIFYANNLLWNEYDVPTQIWDDYYSSVGFANTLIDQLQEVEATDLAKKNQMLGELYTHRAFYLFKLLQYYAPYHDAEKGIPVYLHTGGATYGVANPRKTQQEVYDIIINDLNEALGLMEVTAPKTGFNVWYNKLYINNLMAQVYWFKAESGAKAADDYKMAEKYSSAAIEGVDAYIPNTAGKINEAAAGTLTGYPAYINNSNLYGGVAGIYGSPWWYIGYSPTQIPVSEDLLDLFTDDDVRAAAYFSGPYANDAWPEGNAYSSKNGAFRLFQPEEAFLILAEALYRQDKEEESRQVLNKFKAFFNAGTVDASVSGDALLTAIKNERRKEFFFQRDYRWIDLKRYGGVTLERSFVFFRKSYSVTVPPDDFRYALPIPLTEIQQNPLVTPNPGWVEINF